mmetsp:Transcript_21601/g.55295  ORF Transcript_21601/g.55295 Transcript_21601/m.55295 type:complete len:350 (-) Transcript_21601:167-1216(-)
MPIFPIAPEQLQMSSPDDDNKSWTSKDWEDVGDETSFGGPLPRSCNLPGFAGAQEVVSFRGAPTPERQPSECLHHGARPQALPDLRPPAQPDGHVGRVSWAKQQTWALAVPAESENDSDAAISFSNLSIEPEYRPGAAIKAARRQAKVTDAIVAKLSNSFVRQHHQLVPPEQVVERRKAEIAQMQQQVEELMAANAALRIEIEDVLASRRSDLPTGPIAESQAMVETVACETAAMAQAKQSTELVLTELADLQRTGSTIKLQEINSQYEARVAEEHTSLSQANDACQLLEDRMVDARTRLKLAESAQEQARGGIRAAETEHMALLERSRGLENRLDELGDYDHGEDCVL